MCRFRDAALHIKNEKTIKLGAGKTFDIGVHKVTQNWNVNKLTYNNRPAYEVGASATGWNPEGREIPVRCNGHCKGMYAEKPTTVWH